MQRIHSPPAMNLCDFSFVQISFEYLLFCKQKHKNRKTTEQKKISRVAPPTNMAIYLLLTINCIQYAVSLTHLLTYFYIKNLHVYL